MSESEIFTEDSLFVKYRDTVLCDEITFQFPFNFLLG